MYVFILMPILSAIKVLTQARYSKKSLNTFSDVLLYNAIAFFFSALVLSIIFLRQLPPIEVWLYACISAITNVLYQIFYTLTLKTGPVAVSAIINSFNIVFTLLAGAIFFNEQWSVYTIIGFAFMSVAFCLVPTKTDNKKANLKWLCFIILTFVSCGLYGVVMLFFSKSQFGTMKSEYVAITFTIASVICLILAFFNTKVRKEPISIKRNFELPIVTLVIGGTLGLYNLLNVIAFQKFPSYIVSPVISGLIIILTMLASAVINKEKITLKMLIGTIFAVIAIVLLNL